MVNPAPVQNSVDTLEEKTKRLKLSMVWTQWFNYLVNFLSNMVDYSGASQQVPTNGFSITMGNSTQVLQLVPAGVLATGAVTLPASPTNGQIAEILSTKTVTAFTLNPNTGQTVNNAPTTLTGGTGISLYYNKGSATWFRRY